MNLSKSNYKKLFDGLSSRYTFMKVNTYYAIGIKFVYMIKIYLHVKQKTLFLVVLMINIQKGKMRFQNVKCIVNYPKVFNYIVQSQK